MKSNSKAPSKSPWKASQDAKKADPKVSFRIREPGPGNAADTFKSICKMLIIVNFQSIAEIGPSCTYCPAAALQNGAFMSA